MNQFGRVAVKKKKREKLWKFNLSSKQVMSDSASARKLRSIPLPKL